MNTRYLRDLTYFWCHFPDFKAMSHQVSQSEVLLSFSIFKSFYKILTKYTPNALWKRLVSVLVGFLFDIQISLILKIQSLSVWTSSCENFGLLAEAKCHTVWKMIVLYKSYGLCLQIWVYNAITSRHPGRFFNEYITSITWWKGTSWSFD